MHSPALKQTLQPLNCSGSAFERGLTQGQAYARQMALSFNAVFQSDTAQLLQPIRYPESWARHLAFWLARNQIGGLLSRVQPEALAFAQGLATGSQLPLNYFLFILQLERQLAKRNFQWQAGSILMVSPRFSFSQEPLLIHNLDLPYFAKAFCLFRQTLPETGCRSLEVSLMPMSGSYTGMNEAGVAIACNTGPSSVSPQLPLSLQIQEALQACQSAQEVVRFFETSQLQGGAILGVMDRSGDMYLVELSGQQVHSKQIRDTLLIATNHYQLAEMQNRNLPVNAYYALRQDVKELAGKRIRESSESRLDRLHELTGTRIQFHPDDLLGYFQDHGEQGLADDNSICCHGDYYETAYSVLMQPLSRRFSLSLDCPCQQPHQTYQWF